MNSLFDHGNSQFVKTNIATWILTCASGAFLFFRVWCRIRFSRLSWDDYVLTTSWVCGPSSEINLREGTGISLLMNPREQFILFVACILLSRALATGYETDADKRTFYIFHHASTSMSAVAIAWTKVAFAITLIRIVQNPGLRGVLWAIILTANLVLVLGMLSIWIPACEDARAIYRPVQGLCFSLRDTQYLGGTTIGMITFFVVVIWPICQQEVAAKWYLNSVRGRHRRRASPTALACYKKAPVGHEREDWVDGRHEPRRTDRCCCDLPRLFPVHNVG
jgi:hypothetical protein